MDIVTYGVRNGKSRSGAYLFLPDGDAQSLLSPGSSPHVSIISGPLVSWQWMSSNTMSLSSSGP